MPPYALSKKDFSKVYESMSEDLKKRYPKLSDFSEGSVVRSIYESLSYEIAMLYEQLELVYLSAFIDTGEGTDIDRVAAILNIKRNFPDYSLGSKSGEKEKDDELRERAKNTLKNSGRATIQIIEKALLDMTVKVVHKKKDNDSDTDIAETEISKGRLREVRVLNGRIPGTIDILIDGLNTQNANDIKKRVDEVRAAGIYANLQPVEYIYTNIILNIKIEEELNEKHKDIAKEKVENAVKNFINKLGMGSSIYVSHMTQAVLNIKEVTDLSTFSIETYCDPETKNKRAVYNHEITQIDTKEEWESFIVKEIKIKD
jgi:hypothetical protein